MRRSDRLPDMHPDIESKGTEGLAGASVARLADAGCKAIHEKVHSCRRAPGRREGYFWCPPRRITVSAGRSCVRRKMLTLGQVTTRKPVFDVPLSGVFAERAAIR